jgi:hypothetical protein
MTVKSFPGSKKWLRESSKDQIIGETNQSHSAAG